MERECPPPRIATCADVQGVFTATPAATPVPPGVQLLGTDCQTYDPSGLPAPTARTCADGGPTALLSGDATETWTPQSIVAAVPGEYHAVRTMTATGLVTAADHTILVDATAGPMTITLPACGACAITHVQLRRIDATANVVTIGGTLHALSTTTLAVGNDIEYVCTPTGWYGKAVAAGAAVNCASIQAPFTTAVPCAPVPALVTVLASDCNRYDVNSVVQTAVRKRLIVRSVAASTALVPATDAVIAVTPPAAGATITLANPTGCDPTDFWVKHTGPGLGPVTISGVGMTIDGSASHILSSPRDSAHLVWVAANTWMVL